MTTPTPEGLAKARAFILSHPWVYLTLKKDVFLFDKHARQLACEFRAYAESVWDLAHSAAQCGHARANWKDPQFGTKEYMGDERCEACAALTEQAREIERLKAELRAWDTHNAGFQQERIEWDRQYEELVTMSDTVKQTTWEAAAKDLDLAAEVYERDRGPFAGEDDCPVKAETLREWAENFRARAAAQGGIK